MAFLDEILGVEEAEILDAGAQNSCQVRIISELRAKVTKFVLKTMKIRAVLIYSAVRITNLSHKWAGSASPKHSLCLYVVNGRYMYIDVL